MQKEFHPSLEKPFSEPRKEIRRDYNFTLSDPFGWSNWRGIQSESGEIINEDTMMSIPAVSAAVTQIAGSISSLPLQLFKVTDTGHELDKTNPLWNLVNGNANDWTPTQTLIKQAVTRMLINGRSLTLIDRSASGRILNLFNLDINRTTIRVENNRLLYGYRQADNTYIDYTSDQIIDLVWQYKSDGYTHIVPFERYRDIFGLALSANRFSAIMHEQAGFPTFIATTTQVESPEALEVFEEYINNKIREGRRTKHNVLGLTDGVSLTPLSIDANKLQLLETKKFLISEIARIYRIPPTFLEDLTHATFSNMEQSDTAYVKHTLLELLTQIEKQFNLKLFGRYNNESIVKFDTSELERGDFISRITALKESVTGTVMTSNETRAILGLPPKAGGDNLLAISGTNTLTNIIAQGNDTDDTSSSAQAQEDADTPTPAQVAKIDAKS